MVMDHRGARYRSSWRFWTACCLVFAGCQSVVDPGRTMRPVPAPQGTTVDPSGPSFPLNSTLRDNSNLERQPAAAVLSLPQANLNKSKYHTVQKGDTWSSIAAKFRLTVPQLTAANGIDASTVLQPGQMIYIPDQ